MRISKGAFLVVVAILVPIIVEFRTALSWFGITLSVFETIGLGLVVVLTVLVWAVWPPTDDTGTESVRSSR
ncbi:CbaC protein [Natrinema salsiterrestre]|uniref:CbaC protein n=1 Tax=Natrinema salsiterrestre TaxID=2950540 RepID=A0A9Q4L6Q4_9EURY|nr:CbaC protein [Natrinema salsiterrestre]MDF9748279.1 CbaC protein [Natrinema salsiterrestre]